mgnify:CR=1 FL=1
MVALNHRILNCRMCQRLVDYREHIALIKRAKYKDSDYWGSPVPGFGERGARLLIVGLAPAAHGANRTGRMFTGDKSADFLIGALYRAGFASQPSSSHRNDGLQLLDVYLTAAVRCVPPNDKPTALEQSLCRDYFLEELGYLPSVQVVLTLGRIAFDNYLRACSSQIGERITRKFMHGQSYNISPELPILYASYHPSPRNTNTGRLKAEGLDKILSVIKKRIVPSA